MLGEDDILDSQLVAEIVEKGYSRIPVFYKHDRNNVRNVCYPKKRSFKVHALLHVRDLAMIDKFSEITVRAIAEMNARELRMVDENTTLSKLLDEFKQVSALCDTCNESRETIIWLWSTKHQKLRVSWQSQKQPLLLLRLC